MGGPTVTATRQAMGLASGRDGTKGDDGTRAAIEMENLRPMLAKAPRPEDS